MIVEAAPKPQFPPAEMLRCSWHAYSRNLLPLFLGHLIFTLLNSFVGPFLNGPLWMGLCVQGLQAARGERVKLETAFSGLSRFLPSFLLGLLFTALSIVSFLLFFLPTCLFCWNMLMDQNIPGFILSMSVGMTLSALPSLALVFLYAPSVLFMHEYGLGVLACMEASQKMVLGNRPQWSRLYSAIVLMHLAVFLFCGAGLLLLLPLLAFVKLQAARLLVQLVAGSLLGAVGVLFVMPWTIVMLAEAYRREQDALRPPALLPA